MSSTHGMVFLQASGTTFDMCVVPQQEGLLAVSFETLDAGYKGHCGRTRRPSQIASTHPVSVAIFGYLY